MQVNANVLKYIVLEITSNTADYVENLKGLLRISNTSIVINFSSTVMERGG